jgi:hypothetical protein
MAWRLARFAKFFDGKVPMTLLNRASELGRSGEKRRRSARSSVFVPILVRWEEPNGKAMKAEAQAKEVNTHGGLLQFPKGEALPATEMELTNMLSGEEVHARALAVRRSKSGAVLGVAVELLIPSETFWGLTFRLKKTTAELQSLEHDIKSEQIDAQVLKEFRDSVDYVRTTAWAVQEWQERQAQYRDTATVLPLLVMERVRRALQLCAAISTDLKDRKLTSEMAPVEELRHAAEQLSRDLAELCVAQPES